MALQRVLRRRLRSVHVPVKHRGKTRHTTNRLLKRLGKLKHKRVEGNREHRAAQNKAILLLREHAKRHARLPDDERELANLRKARRDGERRREPGRKECAQRHIDEPFAQHNEGKQRHKLR